jgi:hypothetical protein
LAQALLGHNSHIHTLENFRVFFHTLTQNHALPDLVWSQETQKESFGIGLDNKIHYIWRETKARGMDKIAWNHFLGQWASCG